ncbi:MAG: acetate--CoA ligase family protein [Chloroflexota bacterium]
MNGQARRPSVAPSPDNLLALFAPRSVAVVGASRDRAKLGSLVLRNVKTSGFPGPIYPINPKARRIGGLLAYPSVTAIPNPVDLAVIVVPARAVLPVIADCAAKRVRAAIVISAGFRETGADGAEAERKIVEIARAVGMRVLGPNCLGVIDTTTPLNASFAARMPEANGIAFMSQSGALGTAVLDWAAARDLGFSKFVSLGNQADVTESDVLELWAADETVRAVAAYLEGMSDGRRFRRVATEATRRRPVVVLKAGRTAAGSRAVSSHTGALAGSDLAYSAAFQQSGVIRAPTLEALFDAADAFSLQPVPRGRSLTIVTNAGGPGIVATDAAVAAGLTLAKLSPNTTGALRRGLPPAASVANPIDLLGDAGPDRYQRALDAAVADPSGDALLVILTPQLTTDALATARVVAEARQQTDRPILACFMGSRSVQRGITALAAGQVPNDPFPERAIQALSAMASHAERRARPGEVPRRFAVDPSAVEAAIRQARATGQTNLVGDLAGRIAAAYGVPVPRHALAHDADEAARVAEEIGLPVALKVSSPEVIHKSDVGGVRVGLTDASAVRRAYRDIVASVRQHLPSARIEGVSVWATAPPGLETIVGVSLDATFGHLLLFGLGGIYVEILRDVSLRIVPVTAGEATDMVHAIRAYPLLAGARGHPPADVDLVVEILERVSQLAADFPEIRELDLNPLVVYQAGHGALAVDVRISLSV